MPVLPIVHSVLSSSLCCCIKTAPQLKLKLKLTVIACWGPPADSANYWIAACLSRSPSDDGSENKWEGGGDECGDGDELVEVGEFLGFWDVDGTTGLVCEAEQEVIHCVSVVVSVFTLAPFLKSHGKLLR